MPATVDRRSYAQEAWVFGGVDISMYRVVRLWVIDRELTRTAAVPVPAHQFFSRMFRYSTFIGGPTCTWTPMSPSTRRFGASSSMVMLITRPLS